ncbi:hypothetical protein [Deinococcus maricopensis]|uniref:Uncharacterized protein n=1 Tax=Deinococcus maricopensis (strain DSM 21211 / LMG 22137 / NRRL B-23946 / LB-34) TaxID=709986 RepID=E8U3C2_DEIML|nr:hypothetical protein [Deinococcus maricopensis]ADV65793.1 hypothetical protein Deima_0129 [Deinococcus maricopensis DSM 21211]
MAFLTLTGIRDSRSIIVNFNRVTDVRHIPDQNFPSGSRLYLDVLNSRDEQLYIDVRETLASIQELLQA